MSGPRAVRSLAAACLAAALLALALPAALPAVAGTVPPAPGTTSSGFTVDVAITFSGDAAPGGTGSHVVHVRVPATCWWEPAAGPYTDPTLMLAYYDQLVASGLPDLAVAMLGPRSQYEDAAAAGATVWWFSARCTSFDEYLTYTGAQTQFGGVPLAITTRPFPVVGGAATPPAPRVAPQVLAQAARDAMVIPVPAVERNPKISSGGAIAGATFVNLPTWFWVTNPAAVGGATGTRTIRAEVGGGAVFAEVVARTQGLTISAPTGSTRCPPGRALQVWHAGAADSTGCTVTFPRASVAYPSGGYPVATSTAWQATWTGSGGTGGVLPVLPRTAVVNVPVAEAQSVVTGLS
jgi:hypothetical protein